MAAEYYSDKELEKYRGLQKLTYQLTEQVASELYEGITEKQAAQMLEERFKAHGIHTFFHAGFAWFGDRSRFKGFNRPLDFRNMPGLRELPHFGREFLPSDRKLQKGMAVILDIAPVLDGRSVDIGYSFSFGEHKGVAQARHDLKHFRSQILDGVKAGKTLAQIYRENNRLIDELGYENCHAVYPLGVLGHKVGRLNTMLPEIRIMGFSIKTFAYLGLEAVTELFGRDHEQPPFWNEETEVIAEPGLWAVEPHIGRDDYGVKWEELLVVTDNEAYWLDDDLPHINYWGGIKNARKQERENRQPAIA